MLKVEIQEGTQKDLPEVLRLFKQPDMDHDILSIEQAQRVFDRIRNYPNYIIYVAKADHKIVGAFSLLIMDKLSHMGAKSGIVDDVVVHQAWQGRGIGKQLMQFAMDRCRESGCYKLALTSDVKREAAHHFYEKLGFKKHGYSFIVEFAKEGEESS
jgi:GNAT superfamily N-acetyltransferase